MSKFDWKSIDLLVLDVDGVLTDGRISLTESGEEIKSFHVRDGSGMKYWQRVGKKLAIVTGRGSPAVTHRARELSVDAVRLNAKNKLPALQEVLAELNIPAERTAVVGDDLPDLPMMRHCACGIAPANAVEEVLSAADHITELPGGEGCVREVVEMILKSTGLWSQILQRYLLAHEDGTT